MKAFLIASAAFVIVVTSAFADSEHTCVGNANCSVTNSDTTNNVATSSAAAAASASNVNAPITVNTNIAKGGNSSNRNTNKQGQAQLQGQTQTQRQSIDDSGNSNVAITNPRQPVSSAVAAALAASDEACMGSSTIGGQGVGFGLSFGTTWTDDACQARKDAASLALLGYADAARARLCQTEGNREAFAKTGQPCDGEAPAATPAPVAGTSEPMQPVD